MMTSGRVCAATLAALFVLAAPARAQDTRLLEHAYDPKEVVRIDGKAGVQATIAFGQNEAIENVAVGDSQKWQITPNKRADLLFVKPLESTARTNMTVVTNKRTYFFDLVASTKAKPLYMLRFTYKDEPVVAPAASAAGALAALDPAERMVADGNLADVPIDPAALNFAWKRTGDAKLLPSRIYDDGASTFLTWPARTAVPAILMFNERGEEGAVNYAVRGNTIVLPDVPSSLILRSGKSVARLQNERPTANRADVPQPPILATKGDAAAPVSAAANLTKDN